MPELPTVLLDSNEAHESKQLIHNLREFYGPDKVVVAPLPVDIALYTDRGEHLIERKVVPNDLVSSLSDGRYNKQFRLVRDCSGGGAFLFEGTMNFHPETGKVREGARFRHFTYKQWVGLRMSIMASGIMILDSPGPAWTPATILEAYNWFSKEKHDSMSRRKHQPYDWGVPTGKEDATFALQGFKFGAAQARAAWKEFGTVRDVIMADPENLEQVSGVGPATVKKMQDILDLEVGPND